jgi:hypothetical protein
MRNVAAALLILAAIAIAVAQAVAPSEEASQASSEKKAAAQASRARSKTIPNLEPRRPAAEIEAQLQALGWPPQIGETFPDLELLDQEGQPFRLSSLEGKVVIVEMAAMTCPGTQALSGGNYKGGFGKMTPQKDCKALDELLPQYAKGLELSEIVLVQILLYDLKMKSPQPEDAAAWAEHFSLSRASGQIVVVPAEDLRCRPIYSATPGFYLLDQALAVRCDAAGRNQANLYSKLLPMVPKLLREE